ncbi:hypothetical protein [Aquipuribacter nitratireducens]|uniref:Uncharacterized protein n=1 Tax=Aquipuribacter nitratireducens TaxID=650104 RepID=A0ABW0GM55_9MICO
MVGLETAALPLTVVSLVLNVLVLVPVTGSLLLGARWPAGAYGERTPARDILLAIYLAILAGSAALLVTVLVASRRLPDLEPAVLALLGLQVVYKVLSGVTVRDLRNPVVLSNLGIAVVHSVTIALLVSS